MKKIFTFLILSCALFCLSAEWDFGDFNLNLSPMDPLFKESRAYPFTNNVTFRYMYAPKDTEYLPTDILVADDTLNADGGGV